MENYSCQHKGCSFEHEDKQQVLLHEAMTYHCLSCQMPGPELTNINIHQLCNSCTEIIEWELPEEVCPKEV